MSEALRAVTFSTTAGAVVGARTVSFVVTDVEGLSSVSVPLAVTVLALNLPPVVTTSVVGPIVTAGSGPVTLDANVTIMTSRRLPGPPWRSPSVTTPLIRWETSPRRIIGSPAHTMRRLECLP